MTQGVSTLGSLCTWTSSKALQMEESRRHLDQTPPQLASLDVNEHSVHYPPSVTVDKVSFQNAHAFPLHA